MAQTVKNLPIMQETWVCPRIRKILCNSAGKESACNAGDVDLTPGLGRPPGEGEGYPFQYSGLENSVDYKIHGVAKSQTGLSNFHFHFSLSLSGRSLKEGNGYPLQYSCLENSMDRGAFWAIVHRATKSHVCLTFSLSLCKSPSAV